MGLRDSTYNPAGIPKVLGIIGGVMFLAGALPFISWGLTLFSYVGTVIGSGLLMIITSIFARGKKSQDRLVPVLGAIAALVGFGSFKIVALFNLGSSYAITQANLGDPVTVGFIIGLTGFLLTMSPHVSSSKQT